MNKTLLLLLTVAVSAFVMGGTTLLFLDKRYIRADWTPEHPSDSSPSLVRPEDGTQICWGECKVVHDAANETRTFDAMFEKPFADNPRVTMSIHPTYRGRAVIAWSEFKHTITSTNYEGQISGVGITPADWRIPVLIDYVAIGRWRK